jgi:hypothetical protein
LPSTYASWAWPPVAIVVWTMGAAGFDTSTTENWDVNPQQ